MSHADGLDRRSVLGASATATVALLAGCASGGSGDASDSGGGSGDGDDGDSNGGSEGGDSGGGDGDAAFGGWFDGVSNFDGVADRTGRDRVTVRVGTGANGGNFGFSPPAVRVSPGTTVVWEWTGKGASHNVVHDGGEFESDLTDEDGHSFEHEFGGTGTYRYVCEPHAAMGMKGLVAVE